MKRPFVPRGERGAALLAVLLLVAVTGAIAAAALEKMSLSRQAATNIVALDQARAHANGIEQLAMLTIDDRIASDPDKTTLAGGWNGAARRVALPGGGVALARVQDGGNCFNVNSVVEGDPRTRLTRRDSGVSELAGLMQALEVPEVEARRIAEAAADWADSDSVPGPGGAEDSAYAAGAEPYRTANTLFADPGELAALIGINPEIMARLRPWLCALPTTELSPININTLLPEQAPLLAMLAPGRLGVERARRVLAARPASGWDNQIEFWRIDALRDLNVPLDVQLQLQMRTRWYALEVRVAIMEAEFTETALIDARLQPSRLVARRWGESTRVRSGFRRGAMKSVLLFANQDAGLEARLQAALDIVRTFEGHLTCLQVTPYDSFIMGDPFGGIYALPTVVEQVQKTAEAHRRVIEARLGGEGVAWDWLRFDGAPAQLLVDRARLADLIVLSLPGADATAAQGAHAIAADVLVHARSPVLAVPVAGRGFDGLGRALVAWDGWIESSHALRLTMPMLERASQVHVVTVSEGNTEFPATDASLYLARHGVESELTEWPRGGRSVAAALLDAATSLAADYLVMGAYGHTRMREAVLGGATRDMLRESGLPLLMAH